MKPTKEEYREWLRNPITKWVIQEVNEERRHRERQCGSGGGIIDFSSSYKTSASLIQIVGYIDGLEYFTRLEGQAEDEPKEIK